MCRNPRGRLVGGAPGYWKNSDDGRRNCLKGTKLMKPAVRVLLCVFSVAMLSGCRRKTAPVFGYVSSNWRTPPYSLRMDSVWEDEGIEAKGENYYFLPKPLPGRNYSERFDPRSNYFQSWFGVYAIEDTNQKTYALSNNTLDAKAIFDIALADQKAWLRSLGLSTPIAAMDLSGDSLISQIPIAGHPGWKVTGKMNTNVDVGEKNPRSLFPSLPVAPSTAWRDYIESYGIANLEVVFYVWYSSENKELLVIYYTGIEFYDLDNAYHRTLPLISAELDAMARGVAIS
jgi:hypothetical protein